MPLNDTLSRISPFSSTHTCTWNGSLYQPFSLAIFAQTRGAPRLSYLLRSYSLLWLNLIGSFESCLGLFVAILGWPRLFDTNLPGRGPYRECLTKRSVHRTYLQADIGSAPQALQLSPISHIYSCRCPVRTHSPPPISFESHRFTNHVSRFVYPLYSVVTIDDCGVAA